MAKYQNISDFRQSIVNQGKRLLLRPGDVFESDRVLHDPFLEKVSDDTPITVREGRYVREVDKLAEKVANLEQEKENLAAVKTAVVEENVGALQAAINDLRSDLSEDINDLKNKLTEIVKSYNDQKEDHQKTVEVIMKRLGILKSAMMTMEEAIYGPMENDEGN